MRRFIFAILLLLATVLLCARLGPVTGFLDALRRGQPVWLGLAFITQAMWQVNQAAEYRAAHRAVGVELTLAQMLPVVAANNFMLVAAPSGSLSTFALFLANARREDLPPARVTLAVTLFAVAQYLGASCVLVGALALLWQQRVLNAGELLPALVLFGATGAMAGLLWLSLKSLAQLERVGLWLIRLGNRALRRNLISEIAWRAFLAEAAGGFELLRRQPLKIWLMPCALSLTGEGLAMILLSLIFAGFGQPLSAVAIVGGVSLSTLFTVVSPTPLGIGVAEGAVTLALSTVNVPLASALLISLTYRGFVVWLPMLYGFIALQASGLRTALTREKMEAKRS
jgi:hypothetical protein